MSISQKIEFFHKNRIEMIKNMSNGLDKDLAVGSLVADLGKRSIRAVSKAVGFCWRKVKKCYDIFINGIIIKEEHRGRKSIIDHFPNIEIHVKEILDKYEQTDSHFKTDILFIDISPDNLRIELIKKCDEYTEQDCPSVSSFRRLLKKLGYKYSKILRNKVYDKIPETDEIFENVHETMGFALKTDDSVAAISIDDKVRKLIGNISERGYSWLEKEALDHDTNFKYSVIPFGILDLKTNETFVSCTLGKSTAEFKVDMIEEYVKYQLEHHSLKTLIIFSDNGPENSGRRKLWLKKLVELAKKYKIRIELAYYPPYHSKYNKIERYWARLQLTWRGTVIDDLPLLVKIMNKVTWKGIQTKAKIVLKEYKSGIKVDNIEMKYLEEHHIYRDEKLSKWSIVITP